jgi:methyl-accepting chemotaxis protein
MLNRLSIKAKLIGMAILTAVIILGLTGMSVYSIRKGSSALAEVYEHNVQPLILLQEMDSVLKEVRFRMVAVPLDQMSIKGSRDQLNEARERIPQIWAEFNTIMKDAHLDDQDKEVVASIDKEVAGLNTFFRKLDGIYETNNKDALLAPLQEEWPLINRNLLKPLAQLIPAQDAAVKRIYESSVALGQKQMAASLILMSISLVLLLAFTFALIRGILRSLATAQQVAATIAGGDLSSTIDASQKDEVGQLLLSMKNMNTSLAEIVGNVRVSTDSIATAAKEIAQGNAELSSRTEQQASSLEETASSMEQMSATVKQNAENAKLANQLAESASDIAVKGGVVVDKVVDTMASISESSKKIVDIISVIESIAFQTNILALNAAVEAARAGEHGRGFAVVAGEVRNLSQRSSTSAKDIKALIDDSVSKVNAGSKLVDQAGTTMTEVVTSIKRVTDIMSEISAASSEQSAGIDQVNQAITQMDDVTQQNAAQVEEAAAAAEAMEEQAQVLQQAVSIFKLDNVDESTQPSAHTKPMLASLNTLTAVAPARKARKQLTVTESKDGDWKEF